MNSDPRMSDLLLLWEERCEQGAPICVEELCRDCPHLLEELRRQVQALQAMNPLLRPTALGLAEKETSLPGATPAPSGSDGESLSSPWLAIPGYEIERELGRGGMGVVYLARQLRLNRRVALKMILPESCGSAQQRQRFRTEAEIIAGLQHPHIVQIFDVGEVDGRAFCALELIEGGNLAEALAGQPCPPRVAAELLATLADAVQAAHEKGVLHRDLKPANVLLASACGLAENYSDLPAKPQAARQALDGVIPKLTDFGLAKQLAANQGLTQSGMVMGTPSYIAPEQVQGRNRELGPPADVYSLGAILYEALTGRPPLLGPTVLETFQLVLSHDPLPVRSLQPAVPHDLDTICLKCLHKDPSRRYATARELGDDLRRFLAGEAVRARPTPTWERAYKWARRRPATAALVAMLVLALGGGIYLQRQHELRGLEQARRHRELRTAAESTLDKVGELTGRACWREARALLEQACGQLNQDVPEELRLRLQQALADVILVDDIDAIRLSKASIVEGTFDFASAERGYEALFRGRGLGSPGDDPTLVAARIRASAAKEQLIAAVDDWADAVRNVWRRNWLLQVARLADPDPWRDQLRDPVVLSDQKKLEALVVPARLAELAPQTAAALVRRLGKDRLIASLSAVYRRHPDDFWVNFQLGTTLVMKKRSAEAIGYLRAAVALRPSVAVALSNLGGALREKGEVEEAIACYHRAIKVDPKFGAAYTNLGRAIYGKGKVDEAIAWYHKAIAADPQDSIAHNNLGLALMAKGKVDEAIASFHSAIAANPQNAAAHLNFGRAVKDKGKVDEAIACYRRAIALDPSLAQAHTNLGAELNAKGKLVEAIECYRRAIASEPGFAPAHYNLGEVLQTQRKLDQAMECYRRAIALDPSIAAAHGHMGGVLLDQGKLDEAMPCFHKAIELNPGYADAYHGLGVVLYTKGQAGKAIPSLEKAIELDPRKAEMHVNLGLALKARGEMDRAIRCYRKAIELNPQFAYAHECLGESLCDKGQLAEAIRCLEKAVELNPRKAVTHFNLATILKATGKMDRAIHCYRKAIALDPRLGNAYNPLGTLLANVKHDLDGAIECFRKAVAFNPKNVEARENLGNGLFLTRHYAEARDAWSRALDLLPPGNPVRTRISGNIATCEWRLKLEQRLPKLLSGEQKASSAPECLDLAVMCQQDKQMHAAAARFYAEAFVLQPRLARNLNEQHRYNAACSAALAGCGKGKDSASQTAADRLALCLRALTWLRADLAAWQRMLASARPKQVEQARHMLRHWQNDADLAGLRDAIALAKLSAEERSACQRLWADVAGLLKGTVAGNKGLDREEES